MSINPQLQEAYRLIRDNRKPDAMRILVPIVKADANNADAWWLLANAVPDPTQARRALEQVLRLRPGDDKAQKMLDRLTSGAAFPSAPPVGMSPPSFSGSGLSSPAGRDPADRDPAGRDPFGIPPSDPAANVAPNWASRDEQYGPGSPGSDPFGPVSGGTFGAPGSGSSDPFGVPPRSGRDVPPVFMPVAPPKRSGGGCRAVLIGCGIISLLCIVACAASLFFASAQLRTVIDEIATQNPELGGALSQAFDAILQGNTPDPAILRTLEASGFNITIDPALGGQLGTLTGGNPIAAANTLVAGGVASNPTVSALATQAAAGGVNLGGLLNSGITELPGAPLPANVQMRGAIEAGQDVTGQLAVGGAPQGYTLRASRGTVITLTVTATANNALDPLVALYGADGTQLAFNDDSDVTSERFNSRLEFTIPVDGTYTIVVSSFLAGSGGDFTLRVQQN